MTADNPQSADQLQVAEVMHRGVIGCPSSETVAEAARLLVAHRVHALIVETDTEQAPIQVLADVDLLGALAGGGDPDQITVGSVAATEAVAITGTESVGEAARLMSEHEVSHLFVLDSGGAPVGVVSSLDIARAVLRRPRGGVDVGLKMLIAHDARNSGDDAVALARTLAVGPARALTTIVVPFPPAVVGDPPLHAMPNARTWGELCDDLRRQGEAVLRKRAQPMLEGLDFEARVVLDDSPGRALTNLCESEQPDVVVVGSTHRGRLGRLFPGATTDRLLNGSPVPVAVAPAGYAEHALARIATVGVGFDGSEAAVNAIELAARIAADHDAALRVLVVIEPSMIGELEIASEALDAISGRGIADHHAEVLRTAADDQLKRHAVGVRAQIEIEHGDPAAALLDACERHVDLLVLGSRGYGPLRRVLLGSVSTQVTRDASCPVVISPRP